LVHTQLTATRYHATGSAYTGHCANPRHKVHFNQVDGGCTDYTRAPSMPGRARLCLRVVKQAIHTALKGVRAGPGSRAQGPSSLPSLIMNAVISCIRCECNCRILAVHSTTRWKEAQQHATTFTDDPESAVGGRHERSLPSVTSPSECSIRGLCRDLCTRAHI